MDHEKFYDIVRSASILLRESGFLGLGILKRTTVIPPARYAINTYTIAAFLIQTGAECTIPGHEPTITNIEVRSETTAARQKCIVMNTDLIKRSIRFIKKPNTTVDVGIIMIGMAHIITRKAMSRNGLIINALIPVLAQNRARYSSRNLQ